VSDIAESLLSYDLLLIGATGGLALLTGGNPGRGGPRGPGLPEGLSLPLFFLNLVLIWNQNSFSFSRLIQPSAPRINSIRIINVHIHHVKPSEISVVFVRQQTSAPSQEYNETGSWKSEHVPIHV